MIIFFPNIPVLGPDLLKSIPQAKKNKKKVECFAQVQTMQVTYRRLQVNQNWRFVMLLKGLGI